MHVNIPTIKKNHWDEQIASFLKKSAIIQKLNIFNSQCLKVKFHSFHPVHAKISTKKRNFNSSRNKINE